MTKPDDALDGEIITPGDAKRDDELTALKARLAALEAAAKPAPTARDFEREAAEWRDQMHKLAEARMGSVAVAPEVLRDYARACPTSDVQDLVRHGRVQSPSQAGTSGQVTAVRGSLTPGWAREIPLSPPPGQRYINQQMDAQDAKDRAERIAQAQAMKGK
jgi:hypothetical protein